MTTSPSPAPGRHRKNCPPTWVGIAPLRWYLITILIILIVLTLGGLL